ncbi:MAG: hypothetical protein A2600_05720 [Candidatus Lambdaproteobacteria bacterium RIFOXYD1_FULL_56_27]|uniref:KAP NTPase domain-containing protein n=1 Tax=Candidatus Lambdaproteobacteria bacterium RIFOXYD2_FULL_56_26 TaxID=1817773 RepID=A0A1F6GR91_9PROT|nr:MAG: hypothetical protein A2426_10925 [Candidatus Lambdaproteobacteria bacterium RIFOXYC1_FULL_56_13]OGH00697.1 MAG: hypothetical protein A2557_03425 [Candidatus Lambdaproteobacteria bacterium RIFOXYD2_FULL_56_26]OGH07864.1 MAG: hypothetical protein A2600_05720 [Candidatus Lambdaproteobacteria bacterium RIFOXYD1_FULL_56_27]
MRIDEAIKEPKEDLLDRAPLAERLAAAVLAAGEGASLVVGVTGAWGTGKSSFLNLLKGSLKEKKEAFEKDGKKLALLEFQPWHYANQDQLIEQFFRAFRAGVLKQGEGESNQKIAKLLEALSVAVKPLGESHSLVKLAISGIKGLSKAFGAQEPLSVEAAKAGIASAIRDNKLKLVIFIDELDRLNFTEINQMFQLVKSLADFPNTVYVLGFDREVIEQALESSQPGFGKGYLDKIIQMPFPLPALGRVQIDKFLRDGLQATCKSHQIDLEKLWQTERFDSYDSLQLDRQFKTLRGPIKLLNRLDFALGALREEVDLLDLIGILALEILVPEVHAKIQEHPELFWEPVRGEWETQLSYNEVEPETTRYQTNLIDLLGSNFRKETNYFSLAELFPRISSDYSFQDISSRRKEAIQNNRISAPEHFNAYFNLSLSPGQLTSGLVSRILEDGKDWEGITERMLQLVAPQRYTDFPNFLLDFVDQLPMESVEPLLKAFLKASETLFPTRFDEGWTYSSGDRLVLGLLKREKDQKSRSDLLLRSINSAKVELSLLISLTRDFALEEKEASNRPVEERTLSPSALKEIKRIAIQKISELAQSDGFPTDFGAQVLIWSWAKWGDDQEQDKLREYCLKTVQTEVGLSLIANCSLGQPIFDRTDRFGTRQIEDGKLESFVPPAVFLERAQAYLDSHEPTAPDYVLLQDYVDRAGQKQLNLPQNTPSASPHP